jgi:two-component system phosphate regulon sensor histidine kinase PhoR
MSIFRKSLLTLSLAALLFSAVLVVLVLVFMNSLYYETNTARLHDTAKVFLSLVGEGRAADFLEGKGATGGVFIEAGSGAYRLTMIDRAGNVLWDSSVGGGLVNHIDREEVQAALEGREGSSRRNSISTGMRQIYTALPVHAPDGGIVGVFRLSITVPAFWMRIAPAALPFLLFAGGFAIVAFIMILAFSRSLAGSLGRLVDIAVSVGEASPNGGMPYLAIDTSVSGEAGEFIALEKALRGMAAELHRRIERARSERRRLEAVLDGMSGAVFAADEKLILQLANPRARSLFNMGGCDPSGRSLLEATHSTELEETARAVLVNGRSMDKELVLCAAGMEQRFQVFAAPLAVPRNGNESFVPEGIVMVLEDITRLVRLEQVRKDFVANVSHELRTPIQLIKGFSEMLLDSPLEDKEQIRHCVEIIRKNSGAMENLTNDLLVLASLENRDGAHSGLEEQQLAPLFAEACSSVDPYAKKKDIAVIVDCPVDLKAKVHGLFIMQALINLLDNGIKYSSKHSRIWARAFEENGETVLEVRDEGIGISTEYMERIFERFYRVDRSGSREAGGTGLGLSIVRHIALMHHGKAEVESHAGEGSTFRIRIPVSQ